MRTIQNLCRWWSWLHERGTYVDKWKPRKCYNISSVATDTHHCLNGKGHRKKWIDSSCLLSFSSGFFHSITRRFLPTGSHFVSRLQRQVFLSFTLIPLLHILHYFAYFTCLDNPPPRKSTCVLEWNVTYSILQTGWTIGNPLKRFISHSSPTHSCFHTSDRSLTR